MLFAALSYQLMYTTMSQLLVVMSQQGFCHVMSRGEYDRLMAVVVIDSVTQSSGGDQ